MIAEDISYQTQYLAITFPSPLALTLHIHFYLHSKEPSENAFLIAIALKSANFRAPKIAPKSALETTHFMLFLKNLTKNLEKNLVIMFDEIDQFHKYFFALHATSGDCSLGKFLWLLKQ